MRLTSIHFVSLLIIGCNTSLLQEEDSKNYTEQGIDDSQFEEAKAVRPHNVTGTFLACHQSVYEEQSKGSNANIGCGFYDEKSGERVDASAITKSMDWGYRYDGEFKVDVVVGTEASKFDVYYLFAADPSELEKAVMGLVITLKAITIDGSDILLESKDFIENAARVKTALVTPGSKVWGFSAKQNNANSQQIELSWNKLGPASYLLLYQVNTEVSWNPSNGQEYEAGILEDTEIIYVGSASSFYHTISTSQTGLHHYVVYAFDDSMMYSLPSNLKVEVATSLDQLTQPAASSAAPQSSEATFTPIFPFKK